MNSGYALKSLVKKSPFLCCLKVKKESHSFIAYLHRFSWVLPGWGLLSLFFLSHMCLFEQLHSAICRGADAAENCLRLKKCHVGRCGKEQSPHIGTSHPRWSQSSGCRDMALCDNQTYYSLSAMHYSWVFASIVLGYVFHCLCAQRDWYLADAKCYSPTCLTHKLLIFCFLGFLNLACF